MIFARKSCSVPATVIVLPEQRFTSQSVHGMANFKDGIRRPATLHIFILGASVNARASPRLHSSFRRIARHRDPTGCAVARGRKYFARWQSALRTDARLVWS